MLTSCSNKSGRGSHCGLPTELLQKSVEGIQPCNFVRRSTLESNAASKRRSAPKGGIIIPDTAKEKLQQGEVIAAGPGARDEKGVVQPLGVKAGDRVLFGKWSGSEVVIDGEELLVMKESDIMGVPKGAAASKKKAA